MSDVPEVEIKYQGTNEHGLKGWKAECSSPECEWAMKALELYDELEVLVEAHKQWHEDGMPL